MSADTLIVGKLGGPHGVRGWIKVLSYTDPRENLFEYTPWLIERPSDRGAQWQGYDVESARPQGKGLVVKLKDIDDRDAALQLMHSRVSVREGQLPELEEGEYYWRELIGLEVVTSQGQVLGKVSQLLETGANDVLVVRGERERLIPYIDDVVVAVDLDGAQMRVDWDPEF